MKYRIVTKTADFGEGGTDVGVYVKFSTPIASSNWWDLNNLPEDDMEQGDVDEYIFDVPVDLGNPGDISKATFRFHKGGNQPEWTSVYMILYKSVSGQWVQLWNQGTVTYDKFAGGSRPKADKPIGAIHNGEPWGVTTP